MQQEGYDYNADRARLIGANSLGQLRGSDEGARDLQTITPSDTVDLPSGAPRAIYVGGGGNITLITTGIPAINGRAAVVAGTVLLTALPVGWHPIGCAARIKATGTTATGLVAAY